MSFINASGTFENETGGSPVTVMVPVTGATIAMNSSQRDLYVAPAGTIAALTIKLPQVASGSKVDILCTAIVTALGIQDRLGNVVAGAPTAATAGMALTMRYINRTIGWVKWR